MTVISIMLTMPRLWSLAKVSQQVQSRLYRSFFSRGKHWRHIQKGMHHFLGNTLHYTRPTIIFLHFCELLCHYFCWWDFLESNLTISGIIFSHTYLSSMDIKNFLMLMPPIFSHNICQINKYRVAFASRSKLR